MLSSPFTPIKCVSEHWSLFRNDQHLNVNKHFDGISIMLINGPIIDGHA